jgi:hypothetical protein
MAVTEKQIPRVEIGANGKPTFIETIDPDVLKNLLPSNPDDMALLYKYRRLYNYESPTDIRKSKIQFLARFNITPDQPGYADAFLQLSEEVNSNKVLVGNARRVSQKMQMVESANGSNEQEAIYINDNDDPDGICANCLALGGTQETIQWFVDNNAMPGDRCLGGDSCLCILVPID